MNKYRAKKIRTAEGTFDSKAELARWNDLKLLELAGQITNLRRQVRYRMVVNGVHVCDYIADADYWVPIKPGSSKLRLVVEDKKGFKTPVYKLKKKLMLAVHGVEIVET
jgi:hypothetical protein